MRFAGINPAVGLAVLLLSAQAPPPPAKISDEPLHRLLLENQFARVFRLEVPAGAATRPHGHEKPHVTINIGPGKISNEVKGKDAFVQEFEDGETRTIRGRFVHVIRNLGADTFRNITVEVLQAEAAAPDSSRFEPRVDQFRFKEGASGDLFEDPRVRGYQINLASTGTFLLHDHKFDHVLIALTDLDIRDRRENEGERTMRLLRGDVMWVPGGFRHSLTNAGSEPAVFVTLEFK
jgi:oxalate decarboxylase/phosphoglucose isomerase-like protein (cupin superfamily)